MKITIAPFYLPWSCDYDKYLFIKLQELQTVTHLGSFCKNFSIIKTVEHSTRSGDFDMLETVQLHLHL